MYPDEAKDLAEQWSWEDPERAAEKEEENGMSLEEIAEIRIQSADDSYASILKTMQDRTREQYKDSPELLKRQLETDEMIARELRNEQIKYMN